MHYTYGKLLGKDDGRFFDAVIPNYFDLDDFPSPEAVRDTPKEDYVLFIGRMILRK